MTCRHHGGACKGRNTPALCAAQGKNCGVIDDDQGGQVNCGTCKGKQTCGGGGVANVCGRPHAE